MPIAENLAAIRERIARAAARAGRNPDAITLVAVSKTFPPEKIREAHAAGVRHFGENRVQEWEGKQPLLADLDATWHLVGHLQSNKARRAASLFHVIDSVDSLALAQKLDRALECGGLLVLSVAEGTPLPVRTQPAASVGSADSVGAQHVAPTLVPSRLSILIEVRLSPELSKSGVHPDDLPALAEGILTLPHLDLRGLMTIPPLLSSPEDVRPYFRRLREIRDALRARFESSIQPPTSNFLPHLSMGMSFDFEVAIEEGATQIRLGTALFGART